MDMLAYRNKFKLLFEQLAKPGYVLDPHYADNLLIKLQSTNDPEIAKLLGSPFFSDLLEEALLHVQTSQVAVRAFYLKLIAAASSNELQFAKLYRLPGFALLNQVADISQTDVAPSIRVAYIEMATALTTHSTGVTWLLDTQSWKHIFNLCYQSQTVYVLRAAYKFTGEFLWRLDNFVYEDNIIKILEYILKPIVDSQYQQTDTVTEEEEPSYVTPLLPSLHMLMAVLKNITQSCRPNILVKLLTKHFVIRYNLLVILHITRNEDVILLISKIVFLLSLASLFQTKQEPGNDGNTFLDLSISYFNTVHLYIQKRLVTLLLDYSVTCNLYLSQVCQNHGPLAIKRDGKTFDIEGQVIIIPLVPIICYIKLTIARICNQNLDDYISKLINVSCEHTTRAAYAVRDLIFETDAREIALQSVKRLFLLKNHINRSQANTIFQALFYVLKDFVPIDDSGNLVLNSPPEEMEAKVNIVSHVIDAILMLLKMHNINWHESFEIICLYNIACNILRMPNLPTKLVVQVLSLITLSVKKFIPPNLALLLESKDGTSLHEIGELIYCKMHDHAWEIRDSALELLCECTEIAFIKYIPFQKLIQENNLISTAATIAFNDSEFYVQASALKCIAAASKIMPIWDDLLAHHPDLYIKVTSIFKSNPEGILRKEAVHVMCEIYQNQKTNENFQNRMCKCMVLAALDDPHWEVQLAALKYWRCVIWNQLTYQGMIDGKFPAVTFSRDKRKIVNLTDREIQKNLTVVLENLAANGCLKVLLHTLDEDVDVDVMEASLTISQEFIDILSQYDVSSVIEPEEETTTSVKTEEQMDVSYVNGTNENEASKSDKIIEDILEVDDLNLLANIYENQLKIKTEENKDELEADHRPPVVSDLRAPPYKFLKAFQENSYKAIIEEKRKWNAGIRSLHSVLDDVLGLYENVDVNTLDCY